MNYEVYNEAGEYICTINKRLVERQKLSEQDVEEIKRLHVKRDNVTQQMAAAPSTEGRAFHLQLKELDAMLQEAWKFEVNGKYYKFWLEPHCTCPKLDNEDRYPTGMYVVDMRCPVHGGNNA